MPLSKVETLAELDRRIALVDANLKALRSEIAILEATNPAVSKLRLFIEMGTQSLEGLRVRRGNLVREN